MKLNNRRTAMAMIELIFAIVIMGIVMMGAPMLVSTASQSVTVSLQQEGINEAASRVTMLLTYAWDEQDTNDSCLPPVLHTAGDSELVMEINVSNRRIGVPLGSNSRTFICGTQNDLNASTTLGLDTGEVIKDDVDDFGDINLVLEGTGSGGKDYIEKGTVSIATTITYISDAADYTGTIIAFTPSGAAGGTSSVKEINVTVTSTSGTAELSKNITLRAFTSNIGGYDFESREL